MDRIKEFSQALYLKLKKTYDQGVDENFLVLLVVVIVMMSFMTLMGQQLIALFSRIVAGLSF
jgi:hypothetical protein